MRKFNRIKHSPPQRVLLVEPAAPAEPAAAGESTRKWVESLLTLASLTYGLGFLTVFVHTGRLGLPVLTLLEPIYVLVGLPLTATGLLAFSMWRWLHQEVSGNIQRVRLAMQQYRNPHVPENQDVYTDFWNLYTAVMGVMTFVLPAPTEWLIKLVVKPYEQQARQLLRQDPQARQLAGQLLQKLNALAAGIRHGARLFGVGLLLSAVIAAVAYYIVWLYPHIPQNWGGGAVRQVQLLLSGPLPPALQANQVGKTDDLRVVAVPLLYMTDDFYYVEAASGTRLALARDKVQGVVWVPAAH